MSRLQDFVTTLLTQEGAVVEPIEPEGLDVLATQSVQHALGLPEFARLGFGVAMPHAARRIGLESDWLQRFQSLVGDRGRWTSQVLRAENRPPADPDRVLERALILDNATFRLLGVSPAWTRYLLFDFRFVAVSDEKREGMLRLAVNLATGAMPDAMVHQIAASHGFDAAETNLPTGDLPLSWERARILDLISEGLPVRLDAALAPFVKGLRRRLRRDQDRLYAYHNGLWGEAARRLSTLAREDPARLREQQRIDAIGHEYQAKMNDLGRQYSMRVTVEWIQTLELTMPVHQFDVQIRRRKAQRVIRLDWNTLARRLESPPCEDSLGPVQPRLVCDDALHLVTSAGLAACANCAKPFCRACHRRACPRCGSTVPEFKIAV